VRFVCLSPAYRPPEALIDVVRRLTSRRSRRSVDEDHRGYDVLECAGHRLLVLRWESPDDIKRSAVDSFLGIHLEDLVCTNVGDEKHYGAIYQRFKERIRLPETYVDGLLASRYAQHFYTNEERAQIRARWVRA
jgi:Putative capsular polysaccharide synthesis protein